MTRPSRCFIILFLVAVASCEILQGAPQTFPLKIANGKLDGPGAEIIRTELRTAQFVLCGEDHGFADSPIILRAIAHEARPLGFTYHVVEVGPLSTRLISERLERDGLPGLHQLVHQVPLGIPFLSLREDAELAGEFLGHDSKGTPYLWGVDQEFIGSPGFHLQRLVIIAPNDAARAAADQLLKQETEAAAKGEQDKFLLARFHEADFSALAAQFKGQSEAEQIIAQLQESATIYQLWMSGHNFENNARRARLLAKNFLANYKAAAEVEPKILFKMGVEHVALGTTTVNTVDLGTLATSIAKANGKTALRIAFLPMGGRNATFAPKPGNPVTVEPYQSAEAKEFFAAIGLDETSVAKDQWTLVPLEQVRQSLDNKGLDRLKTFSRFMLLGYDYVITTTEAKPGTFLY